VEGDPSPSTSFPWSNERKRLGKPSKVFLLHERKFFCSCLDGGLNGLCRVKR